MPGRFLTIIIIGFWLLTSAMLFQRDIWPWVRPVDSSPYTIDLLKESQEPPVKWEVYRNGQEIGKATCWVRAQPGNEVFTISNKYTFHDLKLQFLTVELTADSLDVVTEVGREGDLRSLSAEVRGQVKMGGPVMKGKIAGAGEVKDGILEQRWELQMPGVKPVSVMPPAKSKVRDSASFLSVLQPWSHIYNLQGGRRWRVTQFNPLRDAMASLVPGSMDPVLLNVEVIAPGLDDGGELTWNNKDVACWIIEGTGEEYMSKTWVEKSTNRVLRQEAMHLSASGEVEERLALMREAPKK